MPSNTDFRKTLTDPTPLYFAAGVIEKVRTEAPERIAKVRQTDPKAVQERVQGRFQDVLTTLDSDLKKVREQAQHFALQGVGFAAEAAVKAKEGYDTLAEQGKSAVETWRAKSVSEDVVYEATIEREAVVVTEAPADTKQGETKQAEAGGASKTTAKSGTSSTSGTSAKTAGTQKQGEGAKRSTTARQTPAAKKTTGQKSTPKSDS
ncbi:hypothetical protein QNO07_22795 [Streptomyces sp. 549]|uniref:hypothetical protein n=1 Tax=Streptomyces sp. 549 TaxID=3049076 RepID=UPI0024C357FC|nr:hypothetical protein [Streptomyces sp. 549]MDK1476213.1 hypothetical protein [Streptomyces sp. 549]